MNVVYYETNTSSPSTSGAKHTSSKRQERKPVNQIHHRYPRIPKHTQLFFVPLGKQPQFDGEDYSWWSVKTRSHLSSLHPSIWDVI
jgi:exonuclease III